MADKRPDYFKSPNLGRSDLRTIYKDPKLFDMQRKDLIRRPAPSEQMTFGSMLDEYICEGKGPEGLPAGAIEIPFDSRRTKASKNAIKEILAKYPGAKVVTTTEADNFRGEAKKQLEKLKKCTDAIMSTPVAADLLYLNAKSVHQHELYWDDGDNAGVGLKSLPDNVIPGLAIVDLKTTGDVTMEEFLKSSKKYWYHVQAAMAIEGFLVQHGDLLPFIFVCVQTCEPFAVEIYEATPRFLDKGARLKQAAIEKYLHCNETGHWRSVTHNKIVPLEPPKWWDREDEV